MARFPIQAAYDSAQDALVFLVPAADGEGDVVLLTLDVRTLSGEDKRKLRAIRDVGQAQRAPSGNAATRAGVS